MRRKAIVCLLAGCFLPLAFAPVGFTLLAIVAPAILIACWSTARPWQAAKYGFCYGIGFFAVGVSWVYISLHQFGGMPMPLAAVITLLFVIFLAGFPALQGYLLQRCFPDNTLSKQFIIVPLSFALIDGLRGHLFTGFPWLLLGYSQTQTTLASYAPIVGEYGLAVVITLISSILVYYGRLLCRPVTKPVSSLPLLLLITVWLCSLYLSTHTWTRTTGQSIRLSLVQGNIAQVQKWQPSYLSETLTRYWTLTEQHWQSDLIIWPEAAIPIAYQQIQPWLQEIQQQAQLHQSQLLIGIPALADQNRHYLNGLYLLASTHTPYYKRRLVPFGEYIPWQAQLQSLLQYWQIPMADFIAGPQQQPDLITQHGVVIAPFICYEIAYAVLAEHIPADTQLLVTVSNDAWFGHSWAAAQHLQIAQFRSLALQRAGAVTTNNGITALINAHGQLMATLPPFQIGVLTGTVKLHQGITPIMKIGSQRLLLIGLGLLLAFYLWQCAIAWRASVSK